MKTGYLTRVLRDGVGTNLKPFSSPVGLQPSNQDRFVFSPVLWGNQDEFPGDTPAAESFETISGTMEIKEPAIEQQNESNDYLPKSTKDENRELLMSTPSSEDNVFPIPGKQEVYLHYAAQLNKNNPDETNGGNQVKEDESGRQESESSPAVEADNKHEIRVPEANKSSIGSSDFQLKEKNLPFQEPDKRRQLQQLPEPVLPGREFPGKIGPQSPKAEIAGPQTGKEQEITHESETMVKTVEVPKKSTDQKHPHANIVIQSPEKSRFQPQPQKTVMNKPKKEKRPVHQVVRVQEKVIEKETMVKTIEMPIKHTGGQDDKPRKTVTNKPKKEKRPVSPVIMEQEKVYEPETIVKTIEVPGKPTGGQGDKLRKPGMNGSKQAKGYKSETMVKTIEIPKKSNDWQALTAHLRTIPPNKSEKQMEKMAKEIALLNKKLAEHVGREQPEPPEPVFLPKRPASRDLGGWSGLERNYIR